VSAPASPSVVFFDVGGTLLNFSIEPSQLFAKILRERGVQAEPASLYRTMREVEAAFPLPLGIAASSEADYWRAYDARILERMGLPADEGLLDEVARRFRGELTLDPFPETLAVLRAVKEAGFPMGVISNASHGILGDLERTGISGFFDHIVYSQAVGAAKPDPRIFKEALRLFGVSGAQAWHVGDNPEADVNGARAVGIHPLLVDREGRHKAVACVKLGDLRGVVDHLEGA
jgi:putative hydrolase of the HAD superfamily